MDQRNYSGRKKRKSPVYDSVVLAVLLILLAGFLLGYLAGYARAAGSLPGPTDHIEVVEPTAAPTRATPDLVKATPISVIVENERPAYTAEELELLALVIYQEAGADACSDETRQMVGEVALNRVASARYPDTLAEVLAQPYQYGRLHWTGLVWPARAELPQEAHAVARAYAIAEALLAGIVERLLPEDVIYQAEFPQGTETLIESDGFYFCR